ncbi:MAG: hypothetical protein HZB26_00925 [Candidatus Hydrogenedentes bacterium]|nr:hypothetical protein [Candidatus Hydrogenedentota bacterium]
MKLTFRSTRVVVVAGAVWFISAAASAVFTPPGEPFVGLGLSADTPSLITYLTEGIPREVNLVTSAPHRPAALIPVERWTYYASAVSMIGKSKSQEAIPLCLFDS